MIQRLYTNPISANARFTGASGLDIDTAFNISAVSATNISVTGGTGNDTVVGGTANDTISGGAGIDSITGGVGSDVLTGGTGADIFVYRTDLESNMATDTVTKLTNVDTVNFATGDTFSFASATFTDSYAHSTLYSAFNRYATTSNCKIPIAPKIKSLLNKGRNNWVAPSSDNCIKPFSKALALSGSFKRTRLNNSGAKLGIPLNLNNSP
jgi:hypothetical protein